QRDKRKIAIEKLYIMAKHQKMLSEENKENIVLNNTYTLLTVEDPVEQEYNVLKEIPNPWNTLEVSTGHGVEKDSIENSELASIPTYTFQILDTMEIENTHSPKLEISPNTEQLRQEYREYNQNKRSCNANWGNEEHEDNTQDEHVVTNLTYDDDNAEMIIPEEENQIVVKEPADTMITEEDGDTENLNQAIPIKKGNNMDIVHDEIPTQVALQEHESEVLNQDMNYSKDEVGTVGHSDNPSSAGETTVEQRIQLIAETILEVQKENMGNMESE
ncbi:15461_t:CDS:2, partial [Gigaspora margarita]